MKKQGIDISKLDVAEIEQLLAEKKKAEKQKELERRAQYEKERDELVIDLVNRAENLSREMKLFKETALKKLEKFKEKAQKYGDVRSNSKGGFGLRTRDGVMKVAYVRNIKTEYDERADMAEELIMDFLVDKVKKRDLADYKTITALLTRNKAGDFNPVQINTIISIEDNYDDPRWRKAVKLFKESYRITDVSMSVEFFKKDERSKDVSIPLTFASL